MKVLVTGGAGFIGSHIVDAYVKAGHRVTVLDNLSTGRRANLNPAAAFVKADVRATSVRALIKKQRFDVVNHQAAQIDVRHSVEDPGYDADINIRGFLNVLSGASEGGVRKVIFSSSGGTYYGECTRPALENESPSPISPYGIAKMAGEFYVRFFGSFKGLRYTILRYANVFGPRQDPKTEAGVVAIFSQGMIANGPLMIFGNGKQQRDYVFVKDVAQANLKALTKGHNDVFNVGTGKPTSVNELFARIARITSYKLKANYKPERPGELFRSVVSNKKALEGLGWKPSYTFDEGLAETVAFFRTKGAR